MSLTAVPLSSMPPAPDLMAAMMPRAGKGHEKRTSEQAPTQANSQQTEPTVSEQQPKRQPDSSPEPAVRTETEDQRRVIAALKNRDREVRDHEDAHRAAGGDLVRGGSYDYRQGPDGRRYAIGGDVKIDTASTPGDPEATAEKMAQVIRAALAPARPSTTDLAVAAQATAELNRARAESQAESMETLKSTQAATADRGAHSAATAYRATAEQSAETKGSLQLEA